MRRLPWGSQESRQKTYQPEDRTRVVWGQGESWLELKISKAGCLAGASLPENKQHTILFKTEGPGEGLTAMLSGGGERRQREPGLDSQ